VSRYIDPTAYRYALVHDEYEDLDLLDYFSVDDDYRFEDWALVRINHVWRTNTGQLVTGVRIIKESPTVRDIRRLARARLGAQQLEP
jgi:hypothetical protein